MLLGLGEYRQLRDPLLRIADYAFEQDLQMTQHSRDRRFIEQIGVVLQRSSQPFYRSSWITSDQT